MNMVVRLVVPVALGLIAGGVNWWVLHQQIAPRVFVKVTKDLAAGRPFDESALGPLEVSGDVGALGKAVVPYPERAVLFNRPAGRDLREGDLVLWRDASPPPPTVLLAEEDEEALPISLEGISIVPRLLQVGDQVGFLVNRAPEGPARSPATRAPAGGGLDLQYVGPFRILSVGERLGRRPLEEKARAPGGDERVITVAIQRAPGGRALDGDSQLLVEAMDAMHHRRDAGRRVVSILLRPTRRPAAAKEAGG